MGPSACCVGTRRTRLCQCRLGSRIYRRHDWPASNHQRHSAILSVVHRAANEPANYRRFNRLAVHGPSDFSKGWRGDAACVDRNRRQAVKCPRRRTDHAGQPRHSCQIKSVVALWGAGGASRDLIARQRTKVERPRPISPDAAINSAPRHSL